VTPEQPADRPSDAHTSQTIGSSPFARRLGLFSASVVVVSGIIGGGIFINPYLVANLLHTPGLILAAWGAGGVLALCGAFVFAELSTVIPRVGGQYAFCREAFGPVFGFLHGWTLLLVISSGAVAAIAVALADYAIRLTHWPPVIGVPLAAGLLLALSGYHALGVRPGAVLLNVVTTSKVLVLTALIVAGLMAVRAPEAAPSPVTMDTAALVSAFVAALFPIMFAYGGWQNLNFVAEEVVNPLRNLPRAILIGVALVIVVYLSANLAYLRLLSASGLALTRTPAADAAAVVWGETGARLMSVVILVSLFGYLNLALMTAPRVFYAMAADGLFFRAVGRVSPRFHAPAVAILLQGGLGALLALSATYGKLVSFAVFGDWVFFSLSGVALLVFRKTLPHASRTLPAPLYPLTPLLFVLSGLGILVNGFITDLPNALGCSALIAIGVPVYFLWVRLWPQVADKARRIDSPPPVS
jgi:basic amino acid/polyamine antiporter, APA family